MPTDATDGEVVDAIIGRLVWRVLEMITELRSKPLLCREIVVALADQRIIPQKWGESRFGVPGGRPKSFSGG
ncbi:hypothetical protein RhiirA4_487292 [Rhizophagus irregularis]|uniref:Uncharacterized protein n=1 Tax=Rhizophagus irregularis TaxID=588596 RepID=A0A2I1HSC6_9GLOM|nr:hypothetical protein RhiirA4_487292 [Rhizophagus irregularis]